jgi:hypothetical protein
MYEQRYREFKDDGYTYNGWGPWHPADPMDVRANLGAGRDKWNWQILSKKLERGQRVAYCSLVEYRMRRNG